ncbi:hypothetical protein K505DRAFT_334437 [Melanomma pulvis-pyrius CBS 109.77]|uniref:Uncharacterized protein n=1 Tax=Melanomma pulvis-pyrius CBS 109.77 TaxID=1314802 RepID=A0A6A6XLJ6_9PLEO|nr:hypothetical protein K505DRAFT_334437 [Melanomma pulvis-pyrius CBS 109.77]
MVVVEEKERRGRPARKQEERARAGGALAGDFSRLASFVHPATVPNPRSMPVWAPPCRLLLQRWTQRRPGCVQAGGGGVEEEGRGGKRRSRGVIVEAPPTTPSSSSSSSPSPSTPATLRRPGLLAGQLAACGGPHLEFTMETTGGVPGSARRFGRVKLGRAQTGGQSMANLWRAAVHATGHPAAGCSGRQRKWEANGRGRGARTRAHGLEGSLLPCSWKAATARPPQAHSRLTHPVPAAAIGPRPLPESALAGPREILNGFCQSPATRARRRGVLPAGETPVPATRLRPSRPAQSLSLDRTRHSEPRSHAASRA